ncbi:MAG TPA: hypothetical protein DDZ51_29730 [Planctomycetaceae bacterium]|nr:hypothetical protein [Planctomycetaceae bacterium]
MASLRENLAVLAVVPWHPYPLHNGGALRAFHLIRQLGRRCSVQAIFPVSNTSSDDLVRKAFNDDVCNVNVHSFEWATQRRAFSRRIRDRWVTLRESRSLQEPTNSLTLALRDTLVESIRRDPPDVVVLSELESLLCSRQIRKICPEARIIVDMHNVNHQLQKQFDARGSKDRLYGPAYDRLLKKESALSKFAEHVFACSQDDLDVFHKLNGDCFQGTVIPNGVDTRSITFDVRRDKHASRTLVYCASLTTRANIDGLLWFHQVIWPMIIRRCPDMRLTVIGSGDDNPQVASVKQDPKVKLVGRVDELQPLYADAGVSICPLRLGSGTRLKILEAMGFGNPVVSTSIGCEGIAVEDGQTIVVRDRPDAFADAIIELASDQLLFNSIRFNARKLVEEHYDWDVAGSAMFQVIESLASSRRSRTGVS